MGDRVMETIAQLFVPEDYVEVAREKLATFARRATKRGLPIPGLFLTGNTEKRSRATYVEVVLTGDIPKHDGWRLIASVDNIEGKPFFRSVPGETVPVSYRDANPSWCEHCKLSKFRVNTHIVGHDDGRYLQAGSTCIKDYLGWDIAAMVAYYGDIGKIFPDGDDYYSSYEKPSFTPSEVIRCAANVVAVDGKYVKSSEEEDSTKSKVLDILMPQVFDDEYREFLRRYQASTFGEQLFEYTQNAIETMPEWRVLDNDWLYNIVTASRANSIGVRQIGVLCSSVILGLRDIEEKQRQLEGAKSDYFGRVGDKFIAECMVTGCTFFDGRFGTTALVSFVDDDGHVFKWFCTSHPDAWRKIINWRENLPGKSFVFSGTVKAHEEYKGQKQTIITRCKLVEV